VTYLSWLLKAAVFFTVFAFALNNQDKVRVHFFFGNHWDAPLVLVVLAALVLGVALGIAVMLPLWLKARRQAAPGVTEPSPAATTDSPAPPHGI
jgi:lipopolysaccharide assembly protein A